MPDVSLEETITRAYWDSLLVEEGSQRILSAHLFGPHAEEVINVFAVAVRFGIHAEELKQVLFAYPTSASDVVHML